LPKVLSEQVTAPDPLFALLLELYEFPGAA